MITSSTPGATFSWTRGVVAGISNVAGSGSTSPITEILNNTTASPVDVIYTITPSTAAGCTGTPFTYTVTVDATPIITSATSGSICNNTAENYVITSSTPGATFSWTRGVVAGISNVAGSGSTSPITEILNNTTASPVDVIYTITPSTAAGCTGTPFTYTVTVNPTPSVTSPATGIICSNTVQAYAIISSVPGTTFSWTRGSIAGISNAPVTTNSSTINEALINTGITPVDVLYTINSTSPNGCPGIPFTYTVTVNPTPPVPTTADQALCQAIGTVNVDSYVTGINKLWYTSAVGGVGSSIAPTLNTAIGGTTKYYVSQTIISPTGSCEGPRASFTITVSPAATPSVGISVDNGAICKGSAISQSTFTATATNVGSTSPLYKWVVNSDTVQVSTSNVYTTDSLPLGNSTVTCIVIVQSAGCYSSYSATSNALNVQAYQNPTIVSLSTLTPNIEQGSSAIINADVTPSTSSFTWSADPDPDEFTASSLTDVTVTPSKTTVYKLTILPSGGAGVCPEVSDTISITVFTKDFFMPNAFTPNGDGIDDVFRIPPSVSFSLTSFMIFDRWGTKIFETSDISKGWDGTYNGTPADIATYVYVITGNGLNGKISQKGTVVLVR